ncbi:MAG: DNA polymerase II [Gammaproteobacteria bacterium]|nr:DNA polymerase II [Gammaproteobacteria bacterium]
MAAGTEITTQAWLLTRDWRDTDNGLELNFWAASKSGPINLKFSNSRAICFIERDDTVPVDAERKKVTLKNLQNRDVDALYFKRQATLREFALNAEQNGLELFESDLKPTDRFLMERFITGGIEIQGRAIPQASFSEFENPAIRATDYRPVLGVLSFDIETNYKTDEVLSIAGLFYKGEQQTEVVFIQADEAVSTQDEFDCVSFPDEKSLLNGFFQWLSSIDPDVLIGWNVINYDLQILQERARKHALGFAIARGRQSAAILPPSHSGQASTARIPGRVVLDGIDTLRAAFWQFESFALDHVAGELLGKSKLIGGEHNRAEEILELYASDKHALARYNLQDCRLVRDIFQHTDLLNFALEKASVTGLAFGRTGGSIAAFDYLYLPRLHRKGFVAPDARPNQPGGLASPGGYVMDSRPGMYTNVLVLDFKSLYPSIIRTFLIDPLGLHAIGEDKVPGFDGASFHRSQQVLPELIASLWDKREIAKREQNAPMSQAVKIIMNSFYGVLGAAACRYYNPQLTSSITRRGHEIILKTRELIERQGHQVIYGDTDSVFVWLEGQISSEQAQATGKHLADMLNRWWREHIRRQFRLESFLEIEFETHYQRFLMPTMRGSSAGSKKRYAGLIEKPGGEQKLVFKGLETVRSDWTPLAREFQRALFQRVFAEQPVEQYIRDTVSRMFAGEFDQKLRYRKRIRQSLDAYVKNVPPHIQAARQLDNCGRWVDYFITTTGPQPEAMLKAPLDYAHYQDKQLRPVADTILQFIGVNFDDIVSGQMEFF